MVVLMCISEFTDSNNNIVGYNLVDFNGQQIDVELNSLKQAIKQQTIFVINLSLDSDDKLVKCNIETIDHIFNRLEPVKDYTFETKFAEPKREESTDLGQTRFVFERDNSLFLADYIENNLHYGRFTIGSYKFAKYDPESRCSTYIIYFDNLEKKSLFSKSKEIFKCSVALELSVSNKVANIICKGTIGKGFYLEAQAENNFMGRAFALAYKFIRNPELWDTNKFTYINMISNISRQFENYLEFEKIRVRC